MAEIINIVYNGNGVESQNYNQKDSALIADNFINVEFGDPNDYIEYFIYDSNQTLLDSNYDAKNYYPNLTANPTNDTYTSISLEPEKDLKSRGYNRGTLNIQYNFLRNLFNSKFGNFYWIKEISSSRTEIKLSSQTISNIDILNGFNEYQNFVAGLNYYNDFYLNFGNNEHLIAINVAYTEDSEGSYLVIKLYEPLPAEYDIKSQLWIVQKVAESVSYNVDIQIESTQIQNENTLRGPNFNVKVNQTIGQTTPYYNYNNLIASNITSSFQKMLSYYQDKAVQINVDYENFENFIHFSSATQRINNFVYKIGLLEDYQQQLNTQLNLQGGSSNPIVSTTIASISSSMNKIIEDFDNYEYFLYFNSGSKYTWPKSGSAQPYSLYSITSSQAIDWLGSSTIEPTENKISILYSASLYDSLNKDNLASAVPQYILDDESNEPYLLFLNMVGQHFDNIWIYYKDVTNRYNNTNNPNTGISIDLVADALESLGVNLYTNSSISDNLYYSLFGINEDGSLLPPTGSEKINNYVTSSINTLPGNQIQGELYKRIYHNLPYLLKTKGTRNGIEALINIFGIPRNVLTINEFGGFNRYTVSGIDSINNNKINVVTGSLELSASVLHPEVTLQYFNNDNRRNLNKLEVGFSPSDSINASITGSLGFFNIDNFIGNPTYQTMSYYPSLNEEKNSYFDQFSYSHSIREYIRLIKYYNNSLFKMIKDYVPARAELSTGFIIKSHILERNKYERHEPNVTKENNYSQSIETVDVSAYDSLNLNYPTNYIGNINSISGSILVNNSFSWEKYTGKFSGSEIKATENFFDQTRVSSIKYPWTSSVSGAVEIFTTYSLSPLYQNVNSQVKSQFLYKADYNFNQAKPSNYNVLTSSLGCSTCARYRGFCVNVSVCNNDASNDLTYTYLDCDTGTTITGTVAPNTCAVPFCMRQYSLKVQEGISYSLYENEVCGNYKSYNPVQNCYLGFVNVLPGFGNFADFQYLDCTGNPVTTSIGPFINGGDAVLGCMLPDSFVFTAESGAAFFTSDVCGAFTENTTYCTEYAFFATGGGGLESVTASLCNGATLQFRPGTTASQYYCVDSASIQRSSNFVTWSIGSTCTYNPNETPCIRGLVYGTNISRSSGESFTFNYSDCDGNSHTAIAKNQVSFLPAEVCFISGSISISNINYTNQYDISNQTSCGLYITPVTCSNSSSYSTAEIQDYNYYRKSSVNSRYNGSKVESLKYNEYTEGDDSYGNNPSIYYYTNQVAVFTEIESSSFLPNQMLVKIPYLANLDDGLQELNLQNKNWVYVQNIFKQDSFSTVKQFDSTKYSNQKYLDKSRKVIESGYSYRPYYYRATSSLQETECFDTNFAESQGSFGNTFTEVRSTIYGVLDNWNSLQDYRVAPTGSGSFNKFISMYAIPIIINDSGNNLTEWNFNLGGGNSTSGSKYIIPKTGYYNFSANIEFYNQDTNPTPLSSGSFKLQVISGSLIGGYPEGSVLSDTTCSIAAGNGTTGTLNINSTSYLTSGSQIFFKLTGDFNNQYAQGGVPGGIYIKPFWYLRFNSIELDTTICRDLTLPGNPNDVFEAGSLTSNTISLKSTTNAYFTSASSYSPSYSDASNNQSPLYSQFGDIDFSMEPEVGDYFILYYNFNDIGYTVSGSNKPLKLRITDVDLDPTYETKRLTVSPSFPDYITSTSINKFQKIVFLKRVKDETVVIIEGKKRPGATSFGFLIPENINPNVVENISSLQSSIQSQLLSTQTIQ